MKIRHFCNGAAAAALLALAVSSSSFAATANFVPMSTARVAARETYTPATHSGYVKYTIPFKLGDQSEGLSPSVEDTLLSVDADENNPAEGQTPCFQVYIPAGCFVDATGRGTHFSIGGLALNNCGAQVRLHDRATGADVSLNQYVTKFAAALSVSNKSKRGHFKVYVRFSDVDLTSINGMSFVTFVSGNNLAKSIPMTSRLITKGAL